MDPVTITVIFKGFGMVLIILVGGLAVHYGFRLYRDGAGSGKDHYAIEVGPIKATANSVGSVVMATGFLWAWAAVAISPNLDKKGDEVRVYSFETPAGELTSRELVAQIPKFSISHDVKDDNPPSLTLDEIKRLLQNAVKAEEAKKGKSVVSLAGMPATIDFGTLAATKDNKGEVHLTADVKSATKTEEISFQARVNEKKLIFVPAKAY